MKAIKTLWRLPIIILILIKHDIPKIIFKNGLFGFCYLIPYTCYQLFSLNFWTKANKPRGVRIREALEELGPIFVKFGQVLSTRFDMLPEDIVLELVKLQDQVPPFSSKIAIKTIEKAFKLPITELFEHFENTPLAAASIAQVHSAILADGRKVVVKILRPHIHQLIKQDIKLLKTLAAGLNFFSKKAGRFKPQAIVNEFAKVLTLELDLIREAANASQLRRNFEHSNQLIVPEIFWPLTKHNILVMEQVFGIPISNLHLLKQQGFNFQQIAKNLIEIFFTQAFRDCFFHADMHPGNILVCIHNPQNPKLIAVDFGIMGVLSKQDQRYLVENLLAFLNRDYRKVAELHLESNWIPNTTRIDEFEAAIRVVSEPILERSLTEVSFGELLLKLFQMASQFQVNIQPQLLLLQKTLMNIEGLSRQLDPNLDMLNTAKPFLENWIEDQVGIPSLIRRLKAYGPYWMEKLPELPDLIFNALNNLATTQNGSTNVPQPSTAPPSTAATVWLSKDICIGLLLGLSLSLLAILMWRYF